MRTLKSLKAEEQRLRELHTQQSKSEQWAAMQRTGEKLIRVLNQIAALECPKPPTDEH